MRERLNRWMMGRYGTDQLSRCMFLTALVLFIISCFISLHRIPYAIAWVLMIWGYIRVMSRNTSARYAENQKYLQITGRIRRFFTVRKSRFDQRGIYKFYKCPTCKQTVRVPKGRGRIQITCPKCHAEFIKKS